MARRVIGWRARSVVRGALLGGVATAVLAGCTGAASGPVSRPTATAAPAATAAPFLGTPPVGAGPAGTSPDGTVPTATVPGSTAPIPTSPPTAPTAGVLRSTPAADGTAARLDLRTDGAGDPAATGTGTGRVAFDVEYDLVLTCRAPAPRSSLDVAISPQRVDMGGQLDPASYGHVGCTGAPRTLRWRSDTVGPVLLVAVSPPGQPLPTDAVVTAVLRRTSPGATAAPTVAAQPSGNPPAPALATPAPVAGELARVTEASSATETTVTRGDAWTATALCSARDPSRTAGWDVVPVAGGAGAGTDDGSGGDGGVATGTVACDGRPARVTGRWAVTGPVVLRIEPDDTLSRRVVVVLSGPR